MKIQIETNVYADVIRETMRLNKPNYSLLSSVKCWIGESENKNVDEMFGSPWDVTYHNYEEMLFDTQSGDLQRITFLARQYGQKVSLPEFWFNTNSIVGNLRIPHPIKFELLFGDKFWMDPNGRWVCQWSEIALHEKQDNFRLQIAQDLYLLISNKKLCGWLLMNPMHYFEVSTFGDFVGDAGEMAKLLGEFYHLVTAENFDKLLDGDIELYEHLKDLRTRLTTEISNRERAMIIIKELDATVDNFYD